MIDCQMKGYDGLLGAVINERYKVDKALSKGAHGQIYVIEALKKNKKMALKI